MQLLAPGLHAVTISIDSLNAVSESNEANNVSTQYILVGAPVGVAFQNSNANCPPWSGQLEKRGLLSWILPIKSP